MALTDKLKDIADAIREKTNTTAPILLDNMPSKIKSIATTHIDTTGIDQGVIDEANRVANSILPKIKSNSITFIAMSDMHEMGDSDNSSQDIINTYRLANKHAGQGAKLIAQQVPLDFFVNLGDLAWAEYKNDKTTAYDLFTSVEAAKSYLDIRNMTESIMLPGNHDSGLNLVDAFGNLISDDYTMAAIGNYKYIDFENKKVRVIALNTAERANTEASASVGNLSNTQLAWFANALNLSSKSDVANWKIIILSHHPFGNSFIPSATNVLEAYVNGSSITIDSTTYNFSGKNSAKVIGNFHGHTHCFKVANITGTNEIPVKRIAIPNACNGRNNEYGRDSKNYEYGETTTCPTIMVNNEPKQQARKSTIAGQDTAFCAITIDFDKEIIYADCFGSLGSSVEGNTYAGYDRTISYGSEEVVTYSISYNLDNARSSNTTGSISSGSDYITTISASGGYELDSITVTMNGVDISSSVVINGNTIKINNVTGNVVITVTTTLNESPETGDYINLVPTSLDPKDSSKVFNGIGYMDGYYASGANTNYDANSTDYVATGGIYLPSGVQSIYVRGCEWDNTKYTRFFNSSKDTPSSYGSHSIYGDGTGDQQLDGLFIFTQLGDKYFKLTVRSTTVANNYLYNRYYRMSLRGSGANLIITHDQPIPEDETGGQTTTTYSITNNLTNVTNINTATSITSGSPYTATLTANSGYTLTGGTVNVIMDGTDITASVYSNGNIDIPSVTGNIVITATAVTEQSSTNYTNQVPISMNYNGSGVFNGTGYKNSSYVSTTSPYYNTSSQGCCVTGLIPYNSNSPNTIYIKGVGFTTAQSHNRIGFFKGGVCKTTPGVSTLATYFTITPLGTNYYKLTPITSSAMTTWGYDGGIAISAYGDGANMIVTLDEPIE